MGSPEASSNRVAWMVDDDESVQNAVSICLKAIHVKTHVFRSIEQFLETVTSDPVGCMLIDIDLDAKRTGLDLLRIIRNRGWSVPILIVSGAATVSDTLNAVDLGICDVLQKPTPPKELHAAVERALAIPRSDDNDSLGLLRRNLNELTEVETEVLRLMLDGELNKSIAYQLDIGLRSVVRHRSNILEKLGASTVQDAVRMLTLCGIHNLPPRPDPYHHAATHRHRLNLHRRLQELLMNLQLFRAKSAPTEPELESPYISQVETGLTEIIDGLRVNQDHVNDGDDSLPACIIALQNLQEASLLASLMKLYDFVPRINSLDSARLALCDRQQEVEFVITEWDLGDNTGQLIAAVRQAAETTDCRLILLCDTHADDVPAHITALAAAVIQKPLDGIQFMRQLTELHSTAQSRQI